MTNINKLKKINDFGRATDEENNKFSLYDLLTLLYLYDVDIKKVNGIKLTEKDKKELNK